MKQQPQPVFIVGSGRSGTTIAANLLNHLPGVQIAKETGFIGQNVSLLDRIDKAASLTKLIAVVNSWLQQNDWEHRTNEQCFRDFCNRYELSGPAAFIHYVWQLDSQIPWHELSVIGDNTPLHVMAIPAIQRLMPNARFIHMVRDPRDVVCSIRKMRFGADDVVVAGLEWHMYVGCWLLAERTLAPELRIECRYEDLCIDPKTTFGRLAEFVGHSQSDAIAALQKHAAGGAKAAVGFEKVASWSHHTRLTEPLSPTRIGRFKSELTERQIRAIEEVAQYGMLAYGYEPAQWHVHPLMLEDRIGLLRAMLKDLALRCIKRLRRRSA